MATFADTTTTNITLSVQDIVEFINKAYPGKITGNNIVQAAIHVPDTDFDAPDNATLRHTIRSDTLITLTVNNEK